VAKRSAADAAKTRSAILDAARELFTEKGFAATSIAAIAGKAGVTDGAIFHHFKSKRDIFCEIAIALHAQIHREIYKAGLDADSAIEAFKLGSRASMRITQEPANQRIVFIEGPVVLGTEKWREIDQQLGLRLIEGGLLNIAGVSKLPDTILKPMAMLALGTTNEITYALIRKEVGIDPEQCLYLLVRALQLWVDTDVAEWKRQNGI
jgi:AcrR family transcriptional regulator